MGDFDVRVHIGADGAESTISDMNKVDAAARKLENRKIQIKTQIDADNRRLKEIDIELRKLQSQRYEIQAKLDVADSTQQINALKSELNKFKAERIRIQLEGGDTSEVNAKIKEIEADLKDIASGKYKIKLNDNLSEIDAKMNRLKSERSQLLAEKGELKLESDDITAAEKNLQQLDQEVNKNRQLDIDTSNAQSSLSNLAYSFTRIGSSIANFGRSLENIGRNNPLAQLTRTLTTGLVGGLASKVTMNLDDVVGRYDTMRNYAKQMQVLGFNAKESQNAVEDMTTAILGLPIGLDEIVRRAKDFTLITNNLERGTKMAKSFELASLAGNLDARSQLILLRQLRGGLAGGEFTTTQWQSISRMASGVMPFLAEQFGYTKGEVDKFTLAMNKGEISTKDFIKAFEGLADGNRTLQEFLNIQKHTLEAATANTQIAMQRGGVKILQAFDEIFGRAYDKDLIDYVYEFNDRIDKVFGKISDYMLDHSDDILSFFRELGEIDWSGILEGVGTGLLDKVKVLSKVVEFFGGKTLGKFSAYALTMLPIAGKFLVGIGSLFKSIGTLLYGKKITEALGTSKASGKLKKVLSRVFGKGGDLEEAADTITQVDWKGKFAKLGLVAGYIGVIGELGGVIAIFAKVTDMISKIKIGKNFTKNLGAVSALAGGATIIAGSLTAIMTAISSTGIGAGALAIGEGLAAGVEALIAGMGGIIYEFAGLTQKLSDLDIDKSKISDSISAISEIMGEFGTLVTEAGLMTGLTLGAPIIGEISTWLEGKSLKSIIDGLSKLVDFAKKIEGVDTKELSFDKITDLIDFAGKVEEKLDEVYKDRNLSTNAAGRLQAKIKNTASSIKSLSDVATSFKDIQSIVTDDLDLDPNSTTGTISKINQLKTAMDTVLGLFDGFEEETSTTKVAKGTTKAFGADRHKATYTKTTTTKELSKIMQDYSAMFTSLSKIATDFTALQTTIGGASFEVGEGSPFAKFAESVKEVGKILGDEELDSANIESHATALKTAFENLQKVADMTQELNVNTDVATQFKELITNLKSAFTGEDGGLGSLALEITNLSTACQAMANAATTISGMSASFDGIATSAGSAKTKVDELYDAIMKLDGLTVKPKVDLDTSTALRKASSLRSTIMSQIGNLTASVNVAINGYATGGLVGAMRSAAGRATNVAKSHAARNAALARQGHYSTGGVVYRAFGGSIFKPKGTDTVPAMLTPGEFVINRRAVKVLGVNVLRNLNNLNLGTAQRYLSNKGLVSSSTNTYNTKNVKDNHASVVINNYDSGNKLPLRTANRWARGFA